jgi:3-oxoacyl-[acyl-carrier-protein] synthase III
MTALAGVGAFLPSRSVRIEDLADYLELVPRQVQVFQRFHGLAAVPRRAPGETLADLLVGAGRAIPELAGNEHRVRYVLHARAQPVAAPYPVNLVREVSRRLGLDRAGGFAITHHACATSLLAIDAAGRLLAEDGDPDALALVVAGDQIWTKEAEYVAEISVFGEGAGACLVAADGPRDRVLSYVTRSRGEYDGRIMDDPELLARFQREYPEALADVVLGAAEQAGLGLDDIALILPHNVNTVSWRRLAKRIGYPVERIVLSNVPVTGHSTTADAFLNYATAAGRDLLEPGRPYLIAAAGLGATFSAMVLSH